jgi:uncharacterized protein
VKLFLMAVLCVGLSAPVLAQAGDNEPASRDDIILYLRTVHSHDMMQKTMQAMMKPMDQMFRDQFAKDGKKVPSGAEKQYNKMMDGFLKGMPIDEMTQAMIPIYQKHFNKADVSNLIAFYSSPTGQKVLDEMPAITGESMQAMMPIMRNYLDQSKDLLQQQVKELEKESPPAAQDAPVRQ